MEPLRNRKLSTILDLTYALRNGVVALFVTDQQGDPVYDLVTANHEFVDYLVGPENNTLSTLQKEQSGIVVLSLLSPESMPSLLDPETLTAECFCVASFQNGSNFYPNLKDCGSAPVRRGAIRRGTTRPGHKIMSEAPVLTMEQPNGLQMVEIGSEETGLVRFNDLDIRDERLDNINWKSYEGGDDVVARDGYLILSRKEGAAFSSESLLETDLQFAMQLSAVEVVDRGEITIFVTK